MCFEFEAIYWAKLAEEEEKSKKEAEKQRKASDAKPQQRPAYDEDPLPV